MLFARARIAGTGRLWVHAAPPTLAATVRDHSGRESAREDRLARAGPRYPMTLLTRSGNTLLREDRWPDDDDLGATVVLPGGEAGVLVAWWNAVDGSEWRWRVEFANHAS